MAIAQKQISLIHVAKSRLGLSDEVYRDILQKVAGVGSSKELDAAGFVAVMDYMEQLGFSSPARARFNGYGLRRNMATPAQVRYIRGLWEQFTDGRGTDAALGKWLRNKFGVEALRFIDADLAPKVITALRKMNGITRNGARKG
jgi:hypothetical protein